MVILGIILRSNLAYFNLFEHHAGYQFRLWPIRPIFDLFYRQSWPPFGILKNYLKWFLTSKVSKIDKNSLKFVQNRPKGRQMAQILISPIGALVTILRYYTVLCDIFLYSRNEMNCQKSYYHSYHRNDSKIRNDLTTLARVV